MLNLRAVIASGHWDEFQAHRRKDEVQEFHPHRATLHDYLPLVARYTPCEKHCTLPAGGSKARNEPSGRGSTAFD
jgi:hypothetical protein